MSNLIPELRADKNGKLVTRNVKAERAIPKRAVPAPASFSQASQKLAQRLGSAISDMGLRGYGISAVEVMKLARRVPAETAQALLSARGRVLQSGAFDDVLVSALRGKADAERLENIALFYSDDQYYKLWESNGSADLYRVVTEDIQGLRHYPQLNGVTNFYRADNDTRKKAIALVSMMQEADNSGGVQTIEEPDGTRSAVLKDHRLAQLAIDNADNLRRFLDLVNERGCNVDVLIEGLTTTPPLRAGVL